MNAQPTLAPTISLPGQGRAVRAFGDEVIFHLEGKHTGGKLTMWTNITPPGNGPPPHYHLNEDEWFVVQDGRVQFLVHGKWQDVPVGGTVYLPSGVVHTFKNVGDKPSRLLATTTPSGFETFFTRCEEEFAKPGGPDMDRIVAISAEHGIYYL